MSTRPEPEIRNSAMSPQPAEKVSAPRRSLLAPKIKLKTSDLSFYYGSYKALHEVSLEFTENEITALIGPSGCGKSTFLRTLNRIYETIRGARAEGDIRLDGEDVFTTDVTSLRRRVGMVFQRPNPFPKSIYDNISYGVKVNGLRGRSSMDDLVEKSLRRAALWNEVKDKLRKPAYTLSGGQQQRLCIARALAVDPEVLLLDEPCSALDPIATGKIEELLFEIKNQCTMVIVTHNMQQAGRVADRTGFFLMGRLIEFNTTEIIFKTPAKQETEDYITGRFG